MTRRLHQRNEAQPVSSQEVPQHRLKKIDRGQMAARRGSDPEQRSASTTQETPTEVDNAEAEAEAAKLSNEVRLLMRDVPSSVAVITVFCHDPELKTSVPLGVAVSSLSTVTLSPPTISFNIKHPSKTLDAIRANKGQFRVHFPAATHGGAMMVDLFSRGNHPDAYTSRMSAFNMDMHSDELTVKQPSATHSNAPRITNDFVRAAMECTLTQELTVADHVILVARVDSMENGKKRQGSTILYVNGSYTKAREARITLPSSAAAKTVVTRDYPLFSGQEERGD
ncbi:hypothetical protein ACEQ8H_007738 [Pleosporales sp. CAS-2024a]